MALPARTANTMSEAIAISSPNGRMSKRTHDAACRRLAESLFGNTRDEPAPPQIGERDRLLAQAASLRDLASRGMCVRKYTKEAGRLEALAANTDNP